MMNILLYIYISCNNYANHYNYTYIYYTKNDKGIFTLFILPIGESGGKYNVVNTKALDGLDEWQHCNI